MKEEFLKKLQTKKFTTRFAPSATGHLHLGHLVNVIFVYGLHQAYGVNVIFRIEDHDKQRCKPEFVDSICEDMEMMGLWDPEMENHGFNFLQSDREDAFLEFEKFLKQDKFTYYCDCTRKILKERTGNDHNIYDKFCRDRHLMQGQLRFKFPSGKVWFDDVVLGEVNQKPHEQCGDFCIKDTRGNWTYQFAVVVDDYLQGINLIVRGMDLIESTGRQILLMEKLNPISKPLYLHHDLIKTGDGQKLSKHLNSTPIKERVRNGESIEELIGDAAFQIGLVSEKKKYHPNQLGDIVKAWFEKE